MRIIISKYNDEIIDRIKSIYKFNSEGVAPRIAFSYSLQTNKHFDVNIDTVPSSDGRDFRDERMLFGNIIENRSNYVIFKAILDKHYNQSLYEDDFAKLFKLHLDHGLTEIDKKLSKTDFTSGGHVSLLMKLVKNGLDLQSASVSIASNVKIQKEVKEYSEPLSFILGSTEGSDDVVIKINDLTEFDNRNIAIAGMAGSGKTQLIKDVLYQISANTDNQLKYIFFDYKGEGNASQLKTFLDRTKCEFVDILNDGFNFNPLISINISEGERQKIFSIKAFVDTIGSFVPQMGTSQKHILQTVISDLIEDKGDIYPNMTELSDALDSYYVSTKTKPDTLLAAIKDLSCGLFSDEISENIIEKSIYLNLPPTLSDTLRQLCVFLLLRYFNFFFSSTNDAQPKENIIPLRYMIVIDEAHIYLKNKNARKALEDLLRLLRSKGVIVVMLSQGVEDYKTKDFDFASQVKLPICLNVQNKDPKMIKNFIGTPRSEHKLQSAINKLNIQENDAEGAPIKFGLLNFSEPQTIKIRQFWKTIESE
jgi:DNA sulfur modification protein DndE